MYMKMSVLTRAVLAVLVASQWSVAAAAISADEAAKLKHELTPLGAERAGNKDGSIPPWEGGYTTINSGGPRVDPFKDDKPLYTITAKNAGQYESRLTEGLKAMLKKYPDTFRMDVYKTRRTGVATQLVYDNTAKSATHARLENGVLAGAYGGIPFPIPKTGEEVMWNHTMRWRGIATRQNASTYQITSDGKAINISKLEVDYQFPYYYEEGSADRFSSTGGDFFFARILTTAPAIRSGDQFAGHINVNLANAQAWVYLTGQRRVRKLPNSCCDTPNPTTGGMATFDETETFTGRLDKFDWKLLGKQEMYVIYNNNRFNTAKSDAEVLAGHHVNPDYQRWELHRVWVVEATLKPGERHQAPRSRYYCDEDTWHCLLGDRWDSRGQLWKMTWGGAVVSPDLPAVLMPQFGFNDLISGTAFVGGVNTGTAPAPFDKHKRWPDAYFTSDALAGEGVR